MAPPRPFELSCSMKSSTRREVRDEREGPRARLKIGAERKKTNVSFEPIGNDYDLEPGDAIYLDLPLQDVRALEVVVWDNGVAFWLPYHGGQFVLDKDGNEITQL